MDQKNKNDSWLYISFLFFMFFLGFAAAFVIAKNTTFIDSHKQVVTEKCISVTALGQTQDFCKDKQITNIK